MVQLEPRMGAFDAVMFGIEDDPVLRTVIMLVVMLDRAPDIQVVTERTERMTRLNPRLRQRAVGNPVSLAPPRWETDPNFDPDYHLRWHRAPGRRDALAEVLEVAERMSEADFDHARPLWEAAIITDLVDDQSALVIKIHHCITDGIGGLAMAATMFDLTREPADLGEMPDPPNPHHAGLRTRVGQALGFELQTVTRDAMAGAGLAVSASRAAITDPIGFTRSAIATTISTARMLAPQGRPMSTLMTERCLAVDFSVVEAPLDDIKAVAAAAQVTLNTCFLATVVAALRSYHIQMGEVLPRVRVNMPISTRADSDDVGGNRWIPARFVMPTEPQDIHALIHRIEPVVRRAQTDPALPMTSIVYQVLAALPRAMTSSIAGSLMKGVDIAATNVPGPPIPLYAAGALVTLLVPFAPKSGAAINVGLMSYDGRVYLGVNSDPAAVTDPELFTRCLRESVSELLAGAQT